MYGPTTSSPCFVFFVSGHFHTSLHVCHLPLVVGDLTGRGPAAGVTYIPQSPLCLETVNTALVLPSAGRGCAVFTAIKIHKKMESFICKTNNAEEIKHSGELSGPFKNQYEAFHLRPNLFLVIILHILCPPPCLLTHKHIMYHTHARKHTHTLATVTKDFTRTHAESDDSILYINNGNVGWLVIMYQE